MSGPVLCLVEVDHGEIAGTSQRALAVARSLARGPASADLASADLASARLPAAGGLTAVVFGPPGDSADRTAADLACQGVTELCLVASDELTCYAPVAWARAIEQLIAARSAAAVVAPATDRGAEVLAHLGALTGLPVAANCVAAAATGDQNWRLRRHRWAGSLLEDAVLAAPVALLTVAADAVADDGSALLPVAVADDAVADDGAGPEPAIAAPDASGQVFAPVSGGATIPAADVPVTTFAPALQAADLRVRATQSAGQGGGMSLATARVVVGGGRGVGGPDGFAALEELAGLLGGVVGVSRVVTSQGWRPHRQQVGQTGTKISPELYLACGISGAIQHMAGCQSAKHIVAVNTDPDAPIMSRAEYAVIGDLNEVIPALVAAIRAAGGPG